MYRLRDARLRAGTRPGIWCLSGSIRRAIAPAVLLGFVLVGAVAHGHELSATQVDVVLGPTHTYTVVMTSLPDTLVARIDEWRGGDPTPLHADRAQAIRAGAAMLAGRLRLRFDGHPVEPRLDRVVIEPSRSGAISVPGGLLARVYLVGEIPPGARSVSWEGDFIVGSYPVTFSRAPNAAGPTLWLTGSASSGPIDIAALPNPPRTAVARQYLLLGFAHILPKGVDHILFVLGLVLLSRRFTRVLAQVTAFTAAHTITLALAIYGVVSVSPAVVEPLIALSIVYVAIENLFTTDLRPWRLALVFGFGLLHGLGFAGVLTELGLPPSDFLTALLLFNVGVEAGQLVVVAIAWGSLWYLSGHSAASRRYVLTPASLAIASVGIFWTIERLFV